MDVKPGFYVGRDKRYGPAWTHLVHVRQWDPPHLSTLAVPDASPRHPSIPFDQLDLGPRLADCDKLFGIG